MMISRTPHPSLGPFISKLWVSQADQAESLRATRSDSAVEQKYGLEHVLPTGKMHLVIRLDGPPLRIYRDERDGEGVIMARALIGGARSSFYLSDIKGQGGSVGAVLKPGAAKFLFRVAAEELSMRHTRLDQVWGLATDKLQEQLLEVKHPLHQLDIFEAALAKRLPRVADLHPAIAYALQQFELGDRVGSVVRKCGYSHRYLISLFRKEVGLTPKTYCNVLRFQKALALMARIPAFPWARVALEAGFSDQAHFNREFLALTGVTPSIYEKLAPVSPNHLVIPGSAQY